MALPVNKAAEDKLGVLYEAIKSTHAHNSETRNRFLVVDKYLARESDRAVDRRKARLRARTQDKTKIYPNEVPIIYTKVETALGFFSQTYLEGFPIFVAVTSRDKQEVAKMFHALITRDQQQYKWVKNLTQLFRDGLKYNFMAVHTGWDKRFITEGPTQETDAPAPTQKIEQEGNALVRLDPYNTFYDRSVHPTDVAAEGMYVGYIESKSFIATKQMLHRLNDEHKIRRNLQDALSKETGAVDSPLYYTPEILSLMGGTGETDWSEFFGMTHDQGRSNATGRYNVAHLYVRIIPKDYGVVAPRQGAPSVFRLMFINDVLVYVEPLATSVFPIKLGQLFDEGFGMQTKSFAENLIELQDEATSLKAARSAGIRRGTQDRALYDPTRINKRDIDNPNPVSKIPVKMNQQQKDLSSAYFRIPYEDNLAAHYNQELASLMTYVDDVTGINKPFQGAFQKGNKTLFEYQDVMQNSEARLNLVNLQLGSDLLHDVKEELKTNYINFSLLEELYDKKSRTVVEIDPAELAKNKHAIMLADGYTSASKMISAETFQVALQTMPLMPELNQEYSVAEMLVYMLKNQGLEELDDFKREAPLEPTGTPAQPPAGSSGQQ